jgi:N-acetylglucosamine kinase-like BadF-type ATPase
MSYVIGLDGGATKTAAILADMQGNILNRTIAAASNYHAVGQEKSAEAMKTAIMQVLVGAGKSLEDVTATVIGLAGLNNDHDYSVYQKLIEPIGLPGELFIENDIVIAWAASTKCQPGVVVISGTGSSAFGINKEGKRHKSLGWDYIVADQGSGYWVGIHGLQAAYKMWDGRLPEGLLLDAMLDHYDVEDAEAGLSHIYSEDFLDDMKTEVASFGRRVAECAKKGDKVAKDILRQAGEELGQSVCAVIRGLGMADEKFIVGHVGSTFKSGPLLLEPFRERILSLAPDAQIGEAEYRAQVGALIYGYNELGLLTDELLEKLPDRDELED